MAEDKSNKRLGRGLATLIGELDKPVAEKNTESATPNRVPVDRSVPIESVRANVDNPRSRFNEAELEELANSIGEHGIVQPILVRPTGPDTYELIAGERRWRATQMAELDRIPAIIRDVPDDAAIAMALIENIQREDLNPLEEANALKRLIHDCKMTHQQCADAVGRSRASVSNLLRLTELDEEIQDLLRQGKLEMGHGRALLGAAEDQRVALARTVVARAMSVRQTESLVKAANAGESQSVEKPPKSAKITHLEQGLSERLGMAVDIKPGKGGRGRVVIEYRDTGLLEDMIKRLD